MKLVKRLGLLAVAATALMGLAGTASATEITSSTGNTPTLHAESEGHTILHGIVDIACSKATFKATVTSHGPGVTAAAHVSTLTLTECGGTDVTVKKAGSLELHATSPTGNGTVTSSGAEISMLVTSLGITCVLTTSSTHIGTITSGEKPTMHIDSALIPRTGGSIFCGSSWEWTGSFSFNHPTGLAIH
jgi:hypothetical protein